MSSQLKSFVLAVGIAVSGAVAAQEPVQPQAQAQDAAAPADPAAPIALAAAPPPPASPDHTELAEVVVTATKRKESTRSIAGGVTAITQDQLSQTGASSLGEYLSLSPGVNFDEGVPGYSVVTIRGISGDTIPGETQTAVGMYYDDIPLTDPGTPLVVPDIDAFDAQRIEVLRGPQGALYGSASLGGAINHIPDSPDPAKTEFAAFGSGAIMRNSSWGGTGKLMLNAPLFDNHAALRLVGYDIDQPGYIDNTGTHTQQANAVATRGGRAMLGWNLSGNSTLKLSALYQRTTLADEGYVESSQSLQKSTIVPEPTSNDLWLADLHYELKTGIGTLMAIGGYQEKSMSVSLDGASALGIGALGLQFPLDQFGHARGYSGELRLVSDQAGPFNWLAGLSYVYHDERYNVNLDSQTLQGADTLLGLLGIPLPGQVAALTSLFDQGANIRAPEEAVFFEGSYRFFDALKLSFGGRGYRNLVNSSTDGHGLLLLPSGNDVVHTSQSQKAIGFNPKVSLSYDLSRAVMLYSVYSKGYRLGGPNVVPVTPLTSAKQYYNPDKVRNVEVGIKSRFWHGRFTAEVAAYDIGWNGIPLVVQDSAGLFKYLVNAGNARGKGVEGAFGLHPWSFLTWRSAVSYGDSRLKNEFNPNNGRPAAPAGTQLPGAPNWTVTNTLSGEWEWGDHEPSITLIHRYVGGSPSNISFTDVPVGNYHLLDVRAGLKMYGVGITAFAKNITDTFARTATLNQPQATGADLQHIFIAPPRTLGVELTYNFSR